MSVQAAPLLVSSSSLSTSLALETRNLHSMTSKPTLRTVSVTQSRKSSALAIQPRKWATTKISTALERLEKGFFEFGTSGCWGGGHDSERGERRLAATAAHALLTHKRGSRPRRNADPARQVLKGQSIA